MFVNIDILVNLFFCGYLVFTVFKEIDKLYANHKLYDYEAKKLVMIAFGISITSFLVFSTYEFTHNTHFVFALYNMIVMLIMYFRNKFHNYEYGVQIVFMSIMFNLIPTIIIMLIGKMVG